MLQDLRYALRTLRKSPGFTAVAVLTLSLAIGANTAMFSVTNGVLLEPLPIHRQERVVFIHKEAPRDNSLRPFSVADLAALRERGGIFESVAGVQYDGAFPHPMQEGDRALSVMTSLVSGEFFGVLGVRPAAGRLLEAGDAVAGAEPVAVISYGLWQREFGGDARVVGRIIRFPRPMTVVGVAPRGFEYPRGVEFWVPLRLTRDVRAGALGWPWSIIGRLKAGATLAQAQSEATAFVREREAVYPPGIARGQRAVVVPFRDAIVGNLRQSVLVLEAAVALVLLVAAVNVANLLLIRGVRREREVAVRMALGAGSGRITRQLLVESTVLALAGGAVGAVLAYWAVQGLVATAPPELPRVGDVRVNGAVLAFTLVTSLCSTLLFGLAPALTAARADLNPALHGGARAGGERRRTRQFKQVLVVLQVSLALIVVTGAALLAKSLVRLRHVPMGFDAPHVTLVEVAVPRDKYADAERHLGFFDHLVGRLETMPGVTATPVVLAPFSGAGGWDGTVTAEEQGGVEAAENPTVNLEAVAPNYFRTLGIPLRRGRAFTEQDREGSLRVAIVSEATARRTWPGQNPVGKRLKFGAPDSPEAWLTVVGVAADTRYRELAATWPGVYIPFPQAQDAGLLPRYVAVRSALPAGGVIRAVRSAAHELDPAVAVLDADPVGRLLLAPLARPRFDTLLLSGFAALALVLAALGLYGVMAAFVSQRTHEIGVRLALGAETGDVRRLVLGRGMLLALVGVAIGVLGALGAGRALVSLLYDVSPTDPATLIGGTSLLLVVAALACVIPARRATRVDPMVALRYD